MRSQNHLSHDNNDGLMAQNETRSSTQFVSHQKHTMVQRHIIGNNGAHQQPPITLNQITSEQGTFNHFTNPTVHHNYEGDVTKHDQQYRVPSNQEQRFKQQIHYHHQMQLPQPSQHFPFHSPQQGAMRGGIGCVQMYRSHQHLPENMVGASSEDEMGQRMIDGSESQFNCQPTIQHPSTSNTPSKSISTNSPFSTMAAKIPANAPIPNIPPPPSSQSPHQHPTLRNPIQREARATVSVTKRTSPTTILTPHNLVVQENTAIVYQSSNQGLGTTNLVQQPTASPSSASPTSPCHEPSNSTQLMSPTPIPSNCLTSNGGPDSWGKSIKDEFFGPSTVDSKVIAPTTKPGSTHLIDCDMFQHFIRTIDEDLVVDGEVESVLMEMMEEYVDNLLDKSIKMTKHRNGDRVEKEDIQYVLDNYLDTPPSKLTSHHANLPSTSSQPTGCETKHGEGSNKSTKKSYDTKSSSVNDKKSKKI
uniref:Transcription initiation factor TFIID subunit 12 n=1 Tax=Rhabditophanes sp. KR3021 TaxID=114890 RepID=A0AC35U8F7_9BILA